MSNFTTTTTFLHRSNDECELIYNENNEDGTTIRTNIHLGADGIGCHFDHSSATRTPQQSINSDTGTVVVNLGSAGTLFADPKTARKLAKFLNAAAKAAEAGAR